MGRLFLKKIVEFCRVTSQNITGGLTLDHHIIAKDRKIETDGDVAQMTAVTSDVFPSWSFTDTKMISKFWGINNSKDHPLKLLLRRLWAQR